MEIIKCDAQALEQLPEVLHFINKCFPQKIVSVIAVKDNNGHTGLVVMDNNFGTYIRYNGTNYEGVPFRLYEDDLILLSYADYDIYFGEYVAFINKKTGLESNIILAYDDKSDYKGGLVYTQYNPQNDVNCIISYEHVYRENGLVQRIYPMYFDKVSKILIDEKYSDDEKIRLGLTTKKSHYYFRVTNDLFRNLGLIKEYGFNNFLNKKIVLDKNSQRYAKILFKGKYGFDISLYPLQEGLSQEQMQNLISSYGFNMEIPDELVDIYNGDVKEINEVLEAIKLIKEMKTIKDDERVIKLELVLEDD